jgi:regulator of RNase E activity RraA
MALTTRLKDGFNRFLAGANLRLDSITVQRLEEARIDRLAASGHFERPVFPVPERFGNADISTIVEALPQFSQRFATFRDPAENDVGFSFTNNYFRSPDVEVFYTLIRSNKPQQIIEVGSGNSTRVARQAIIDGNLSTRLISIDPQPRSEIDRLADECVRQPVEQLDPAFFDSLSAGDILFIDSSHEVRIGNDGAFLYSTVLPRIAAGVLIQIHDVFLPYDYPADIVELSGSRWNEQTVVHTMLVFGDAFAVIWPGYFLQQTRPDFAASFPHHHGERAQSLWLRKITPPLP